MAVLFKQEWFVRRFDGAKIEPWKLPAGPISYGPAASSLSQTEPADPSSILKLNFNRARLSRASSSPCLISFLERVRANLPSSPTGAEPLKWPTHSVVWPTKGCLRR